jgi:hypothetical protein
LLLFHLDFHSIQMSSQLVGFGLTGQSLCGGLRRLFRLLVLVFARGTVTREVQCGRRCVSNSPPALLV